MDAKTGATEAMTDTPAVSDAYLVAFLTNEWQSAREVHDRAAVTCHKRTTLNYLMGLADEGKIEMRQHMLRGQHGKYLALFRLNQAGVG